MIISMDAKKKKKGISKIQHPFIIEALRKLGLERKFFNVINSIYGKDSSHHKQ